MSKFFDPLVAEGFEWVNTVDGCDYETFLSFDGTPRLAGWKPVQVCRVRADEGQDFKPSDFPWLGSHVLVMRRSAVFALRDLLQAHGEILPLATTDGVALFAFNSKVIDALDEGASTVLRFPSTNRIMALKRVSLVPAAVEGAHIFRLPFRASRTFVSEHFVDRYRAAGLRGLEFREVWSG